MGSFTNCEEREEKAAAETDLRLGGRGARTKQEESFSHGLYKGTGVNSEEQFREARGNHLVTEKVHSVGNANEFFAPWLH